MKAPFLIVSVLSLNLFIPSAYAKRWNTNKDSIVVDAQYSSEEEEIILSDDPSGKAECYTSDGEAGECVTVMRCHPILFSPKGQLRNSGLALIYAQNEDVCSTKNNVEGSSENTSAEKDSQIGQKVICCSKQRILHDLRSELNEDLETYTQAPEPVTEQNVGGDIQTTTLPPIYASDEVIIVESDKSGVQYVAAGTTDSPAIMGQGSGDNTTPPSLTEETTLAGPAVVVEQEQSVAEPQPEPELEIVPEPDVPITSCSPPKTYGDWPVFRDYPWLATIQTRAKTGPTCSGSLITESHILSAAHCIHRFNSRDVARMQIRIGFTKRSVNDTFNDYYVLRNASKIIFHKRFHEQSKMDNNIALIKLDEPVEFDDHISPIGVFNGMGGFDLGNCTAAEAGWIKFGNRKVTGISPGVIHYVEAPMSDFHLRESLSRVYNNEECGEQLNSQINDKMVCAKPNLFEEPNVSTDFFRWNDGGPLVVRLGNTVQQIGIKSWAYEGQQYPTVYTRVDSYLDWIRNNLKM